jgi:tripeptidyl-peptidase I
MFLRNSFTLLSLTLAATCHARTAMKQVDSVQKEVLRTHGWSIAQMLPGDQEVTLEIGLTMQNTDKLMDMLMERSNPKSKDYGKWLDKAEALATFGPENGAKDSVVSWLKSEGVTKIYTDGTWVTFATDIETANRLLVADFQQYEREGIKKIRTTSYSIPENLMQHIELIHPTTFFGQTGEYKPKHMSRSKAVRRESAVERRQLVPAPITPGPVSELDGVKGDAPYFTIDPKCKNGITPDCVRQLYNVGNYTPLATSGSRIAFSSFLNQSYQYEDLELFQKTFKLPYQNATKIFVNNATNSQDPDVAGPNAGEANLDAQNMLGLAAPLPVIEYLTGGSPPFIPDLEMKTQAENSNEPYVPYYKHLLNLQNFELPSVISNSYGEPEQTVPKNYAVLTCNLIGILTLRGVTVFESSGDTGIGSYCTKNDGTNAPTFLPEFPSSCPYITSVGGTQVSSIPSRSLHRAY